MNAIDKKQIKNLVENMILTTSNKSQFTGIEYTNAKGETAQYVININVSYDNAVNNDINKLQSITNEQIEKIQSKNELFTTEMIQKNIQSLLDSFLKNKNRQSDD